MRSKRIAPALLTLGVIVAAIGNPSAATADAGKAYGKPLTGADTTKISRLMAEPDTYVGKVVRVEGRVTAVCEKRGCWMTLAPDEGDRDLRIKVDDGEIVFPIEAKGKRAIAEGAFTRIAMSLEETIAYRKHLAEERDEAFDPASVKEPMTYYEIRATGAVVR